MAAVSGTRSDMSAKPPSYTTQTMSVSRSSAASRELTSSSSSDPFKGRKPSREKTTSSSSRQHSPPKSSADHATTSAKLPPDGLRPLPNGGPGAAPSSRSGEKSAFAADALRNLSMISRQSRKDGGSGPLKVTGPISTSSSSQGFGSSSSRGHAAVADREKATSFDKKPTVYRPPRSSSSVNISTSTRAIANAGDSSLVAVGYPRLVDDLRLGRRNLNASNDNLETSSPSYDRGVRAKTRDVATLSSASGTPKKLAAADAKGFDHADMRGLVSSLRSTHQRTGSDSSINGSEQFNGNNLLQGSKLMRGSVDSKLRKNSRENDEAACSSKNLDLRRQFDSSMGLSGLQNLGNTCFMNSILQCLSNTRSLLEFCLGGNYLTQINTQTSSMKGATIKAYVRLMEEMWRPAGGAGGGSSVVHSSSIGSAVSPTDFKYYISRYSRHFVGTREHDAHEFLVYLLEGLHEDLNRVREKKKKYIDCSDNVETISATEKARLSWERYVECDNSMIIDIFMGQLRSALTCKKCGYVSNTLEPFLALSLPLKQAGSQVSLYDCFKLFSHEETLDGDNKPKCAKCRTRNACTKQMSIQKFPKVLIIHLMRFKHGTSSKLNTQVACPVTGLDLKQFTTVSNNPAAMYNLFAVSNHSGTPLTGHYTAYAKHPFSDQWHCFNDSRVSSISLTSVNSSEAYLLFYELQDSDVPS